MNKLLITNYNLLVDLKTLINVIGLSGSGKTTMLKYLINNIPNQYVFIDNKNTFEFDNRFLKQNIAAIFQDTLFNTNYVSEELIYYQSKAGIEVEESYKRLNDLVKFFQIEDLVDTKLLLLNTYEQNFIKILSFLIIRPKILGIDNLFPYLTLEQKQKIINYAKKHRISIINITTNPEDLLLGSHIIIIKDRLTHACGKTKEILENEDLLKSAGFNYPFICELSNGLKYYELVKEIYFDDQKLIGDLWK